jgi:hypothetical protein
LAFSHGLGHSAPLGATIQLARRGHFVRGVRIRFRSALTPNNDVAKLESYKFGVIDRFVSPAARDPAEIRSKKCVILQ